MGDLTSAKHGKRRNTADRELPTECRAGIGVDLGKKTVPLGALPPRRTPARSRGKARTTPPRNRPPSGRLAASASAKFSSARATGAPDSSGLPQLPQLGSSLKRSLGTRFFA
jgi:hypothetical protein